MNNEPLISIEVAYALPDKQTILSVKVPEGSTVMDAAEQSGITEMYPQIDLSSDKMGVFGKLVPKPAAQAVRQGDRIEIYRPLIADPKVSRAKRAEKAKQNKAKQDPSE